ncbi:hypothetical protein ACIO6T_34470 [Streptomyces sp. NPDC087532]
MWRWPVPPTAWEEEIWSCSWCHAATHVGGDRFEISRPPYPPMELRWDIEGARAKLKRLVKLNVLTEVGAGSSIRKQ